MSQSTARKAYPSDLTDAQWAKMAPRARVANQPFLDAIDGLATCYKALGKPEEASNLRTLLARLDPTPGGRPWNSPDRPKRRDSGGEPGDSM